MAYSSKLAGRIRAYLAEVPGLQIEEKKMFGGLAFMVNAKMCVCVSGENLMCRFDPRLQEAVAAKKRFQEMIMNGRIYKGYCRISPEGIRTDSDFGYYMNLCLDYNKKTEPSKK